MYKKPFLLAGCFSMLLSLSSAAHAANQVDDEIAWLKAQVLGSACVFVRNGGKHMPDEAVSHMEKKQAHFHDEIHSAEDFIRLTATKSLLSGKKYRMECADYDGEAANWLLLQLGTYRAQ